MRRLTTIIITVLCTIVACPAQAETVKGKKKGGTIWLYGDVYDSFTKGAVKAFVTLMNTDSTVVDTATCYTREMRTYSYYGFEVPREEKTYIIKAVAEGYEDICFKREFDVRFS